MDHPSTARPPLFARLPWLRRELLIAGTALLTGLLLLPFLIYAAGQATLGPYHTGGLGAFLRDFYSGLLQGSAPLWAAVLGPFGFVLFLRAVYVLSRRWIPRD